MSYDLSVYLKRSNMPSPEQWRQAIHDAGFAVDLDADFDIETFGGFLPCPVDGKVSGFELTFAECDPEEIEESGLPLDLDFTVVFSIGSNPLEMISALIASGVLAQLSEGWLVDPQVGQSIPANEALEQGRLLLAEACSATQEPPTTTSSNKKVWWKFW